MSDPVREKLIKTLDEAHGVELGARRSKAAAKRAIELYDAAKPAPSPVAVPAPAPAPPEHAPAPAPTPLPQVPVDGLDGWVRTDSFKAYSRFVDAGLLPRPTEIITTKHRFANEELVWPRVFTHGQENGDAGDDLGSWRANEHANAAGLIDPFFRPSAGPINHDHTNFGNRRWHGLLDFDEQVRADDWSIQFDGSSIWWPTLYARDKRTGQLRRVLGLLRRYYKDMPDVADWDFVAARSPGFSAWVEKLRTNPRKQELDWYHFHRLVPVPTGLRAIGGVNNGTSSFVLFKQDGSQVEGRAGIEPLMERMAVGDQFELRVDFGGLWDGKHSDSPDHKSHLAFRENAGDWHEPVINEAYPFRYPHPTLFHLVTIEDWMDLTTPFVLSSDLQRGVAPGTSNHAEYAEAWDHLVKLLWHREAICFHRSCASANFGNGHALHFMPEMTPETHPERYPDGPAFV